MIMATSAVSRHVRPAIAACVNPVLVSGSGAGGVAPARSPFVPSQPIRSDNLSEGDRRPHRTTSGEQRRYVSSRSEFRCRYLITLS
jgi:hypothetical protein